MECPHCNGEGEVIVAIDKDRPVDENTSEEDLKVIRCAKCKGTGEVLNRSGLKKFKDEAWLS